MAGETFQLRFRNNEDLTVSIDEPINFATVDFQLSQKEKGYGRDVSFNGGEVQFEFVKYRNHYLDKLLQYNNTYGFEAIVELIITTVVSPPTIIGELDFATAITDDFEYFKCKVIQQSSKQIVKRRKSVKVDLLSDKDIDGNYIAPLVPQNMIVIAKPITENSRWKSEAMDYIQAVYSYGDGRHNYRNYCSELYDYSIETSYSPSNTGDPDGTIILTATSGDINNIKVNIPSHTISGRVYNRGGGVDSYAKHWFSYRYGADWASAASTEHQFDGAYFQLKYGGQTASYTKSFEFSIDTLPVGHSLWLYHDCYIDHSGNKYSQLEISQSKMNIDIVASVASVNSVVLSFTLIDVMRQVVKSISGLDIYAPRFDIEGEFYYNRLVNGNFLRKVTEVTEIIDDGVNQIPTIVKKPFSISLEDLDKSLVELNIDWQITDYINGTKVFFGNEDDFYANVQIKEFTNTQFSSFNKTFNPRFQINEFNYGYKKFQSQKENEILNSYDVINGESKWVLKNKNVENKKDISIEWVRDSFLIEESRRKAIQLSSSTSSQDDDTLFIIDSKPTTYSSSGTQSLNFFHYYNDDEHLELQNNIIDLLTLPITVGDKFNILNDPDGGNYFIINISQSRIDLERITDIPTNTIASTTTYNWSHTDDFTNITTTGTRTSISLLHTFVSTGVSPQGSRLLKLSKTPFGFTHYVDDLITITTSKNKGNYIINSVNNNYIELRRLADTEPISYGTQYSYGFNPETNPFTSYTNDNFVAKNMIDSDQFSNLRYSIKRNIHNYWRKYLSTCNIYSRIFPITNTSYKNNKFFLSNYNGIQLTENYDILTAFNDTIPTLSPFIYNDVVFANVEYSDYIALQNDVRNTRGYIKTYDNNGLPILLYPINMKYENLSKELTIKAEEKFISIFVPTIQTKAMSPKSGTTQLSGGNILSDGYSAITSKGVVWDTSTNPTIALSTKTNDGTGYGSFTSLLAPLVQFTNYYARAYAINGVGVGYGNQINFLGGVTDIVIGTQTWMVENLDVVKYRNGDIIPQVTDPTAWAGLTTGAWCWYANSSANGLVYGKLYNWYAVNDSRGLAPIGYHVPTNAEWTTLTNYLGGQLIAGEKMKSTTLWNSTLYATNSSGLTAFPAGYRSGSFFSGLESVCCWWTSESVNASSAYYIEINLDGTEVSPPISGSKAYGFSVRLIKE